MDTSSQIRQKARERVYVRMSRTGETLLALSVAMGENYQVMRQFCSIGRLGVRDGLGEPMARRILAWDEANAIPLPELPGKLYESHATRTMDNRFGAGAGERSTARLALRKPSCWSTAPQKPPVSLSLGLVYIRTSPSGMSPSVLLGRISRALSVPYSYSVDGIRQNLLHALRGRKSPVAVALDEAQHLFSRVDTLETLREIGDLARVRMGILVAGNEQVLHLFDPRRKVHFEQWRSRIQQLEEYVLGPSRAEGRQMVLGELPGLSAGKVEAVLDSCEVKDPESGKTYINARRLFNTLRDMRDIADFKGRKPS